MTLGNTKLTNCVAVRNSILEPPGEFIKVGFSRITKQLIPFDAQASLGGTPTDTTAVMTAHRPLSSAMHRNYNIDRPVNSMMLSLRDYQVFLCDDCHPLFPVV